MLRFLLVIMTFLFSLSSYSQTQGKDFASLHLPEIVVLADGMTFEEYLLKQVLDNAKPLKARINTIKYTVTCELEKDIDLKQIPRRRTVTFAARLAGFGKILSALMEHKHFGITMAEDIVYHKGKISASNARMLEMKQKLTDKQIAAFLKHDGMMSSNVYDKFYEKVRDKVKELQKKRRKKQETGMKYSGSYTSGNRTYYIVHLDNMEVHIADGCWQIARISYSEGQNRMNYVFKEIRSGLFLLSSGTAKLYLDREKWPKGFIAMKMGYRYY